MPWNRKRKKILPEHFKKNEQPVISSRWSFYFLCVVFLAVAMYVLFFSQYLVIKQFSVTGAQSLNSAAILEEAQALVAGKYLNIIPKNNYLLLAPQNFGGRIADKFKKIKKAEISKKFPETVAINIEEYVSLLVLCSGGPCYIVDEEGYAYMGADFDSPEVRENKLIRLTDSSGRPIEVGEKVAAAEYVRFVSNLQAAVRAELGWEIADEYITTSRISGEAQAALSDGRKIFFSSAFPLERSVHMAKVFQEDEQFQDIKDKWEYLDLRVENKVYYKLREGPVPASDTEVNESGKQKEE